MLYGYRQVGMSTGSPVQKAVAERGSARFIASIPDDPHHMLVAISLWDAAGYQRELPVAWRMDVRSGTKVKRLTAPMRGAQFVADHHGRIRWLLPRQTMAASRCISIRSTAMAGSCRRT